MKFLGLILTEPFQWPGMVYIPGQVWLTCAEPLPPCPKLCSRFNITQTLWADIGGVIVHKENHSRRKVNDVGWQHYRCSLVSTTSKVWVALIFWAFFHTAVNLSSKLNPATHLPTTSSLLIPTKSFSQILLYTLHMLESWVTPPMAFAL